jgi:hypothetical protein
MVYISEEYMASTFRVEEKAKQKASKTQAAYIGFEVITAVPAACLLLTLFFDSENEADMSLTPDCTAAHPRTP